MTTKKNSLLFKIKITNKEKQFTVIIDLFLQSFTVIDLFLEDGPFQSLLHQIFCIATHNFLLNIYNVTFNDGVDKKILDDLYSKYKEPQQLKLSNDEQITIQVNRPFGYRQIVTLYLMPFDITDEVIKNLTLKWGKLKHFEFGKHKKCPSIHNPYLHLYIEKLKNRQFLTP